MMDCTDQSEMVEVSLIALGDHNKKMRALLDLVLQSYFWKYDVDKEKDRTKILTGFKEVSTFADMILDYLVEAEDDLIHLRKALKESSLGVSDPRE